MTDTQHYQLNQWAADDQVLRTDFNADNAKIDAALGEHAQKLNWLGNCRIETGTYVGTGECGEAHANTLNLLGEPLMVLIYGGGFPAILVPSGQSIRFGSSSSSILYTTVTGHIISWNHGTSSSIQMNAADNTYYYLAICAAE